MKKGIESEGNRLPERFSDTFGIESALPSRTREVVLKFFKFSNSSLKS